MSVLNTIAIWGPAFVVWFVSVFVTVSLYSFTYKLARKLYKELSK